MIVGMKTRKKNEKRKKGGRGELPRPIRMGTVGSVEIAATLGS